MRINFFVGILMLLGLSSCFTIMKSLATPDNIITDDRITGQWISSDSKSLVVQKFMDSKYKSVFDEADHHGYSQTDSIFWTKLYIISYRENNLNYSWLAGIVKIKNQFYINLGPGECLTDQHKNAYDIGKTLETSSLAKFDWKNGNELEIQFLDGDRIKEIILNGNARISHEYDPLFNTFVITASSSELTEFLEKYGNSEMLYKGGNHIDLVRKR